MESRKNELADVYTQLTHFHSTQYLLATRKSDAAVLDPGSISWYVPY